MRSLLTSVGCLAVLASAAPAAEQVDYLRDVKPILAKNCIGCHGAGKAKGKLRLDTAAMALKGGRSGAAVVPGKSGESTLIQSVTDTGDVPKMPPKGRLRADQVAVLKNWIEQGAKAPANEAAAAPGAAPVVKKGGDDDDDDKGRGDRRKRRGRDRMRREREREREKDDD